MRASLYFDSLPHAVKHRLGPSQRLGAFRQQTEKSLGASATLRRCVCKPGMHVPFGLEAIQGRVQRSDANVAVRSLFDFAPDGYSIGLFSKTHNRQKNDLLELAKVLRHICPTS